MESVNSPDPMIDNTAVQAAEMSTCAACGGQSSVAARFCPHCGAARRPSEAVNTAATAVVAPSNETNDRGQSVEAQGASSDFDQRRARQLLDRAFMLAERGDMPAAILACRQSVALAPDAAPGFSMLGLLFERSGELEHAAAAYQKVLAIAPDSRLEYESLQRLRASLVQQKGNGGFHFDDKELFEDGNSSVAGQAPSSTPVGISTDSSPMSTALPLGVGIASGASSTALSGLAPNDPLQSPSGALAPATPVAPTALDFGMMAEPSAAPWQRLVSQPSFFFRGFPLVATTALGLMFMLWSRQAVVSERTQAAQSTGTVPSDLMTPSGTDGDAATGTTQTTDNAPVSNGTQTSSGVGAPDGGTASNNGAAFPIANRPAAGVAPATSSANASSPGARSGRSAARNPGPGSSRPAPRFPANARVSARPPESMNLPPAPLVLPPPQVNQSQPVRPPIQGLPQDNGDSGASSSGGSPLNPAGAAGRGYIRITPPRPATGSVAIPPPVRPANRVVQAERAANTDIRAGRGERAIQNITSAIADGGGKDTGWHYQRRALLFLERGDNQRAVDDFQTAMSAYRDQIRRGENVSEAQSGIQACQSGLRLALSNLRR